jgi:hypothetical protein
MRRRKLTETTQINTRLSTELVRQLETLAKEDRTTFSEQIRARLVDSLVPKRDQSLHEFRASWLRQVRDTIEGEVRKDPEQAKKSEDHWRFLSHLDAMFTIFCGEIEKELDWYVRIPKIRELLRGAPTLSDETASKHKGGKS